MNIKKVLLTLLFFLSTLYSNELIELNTRDNIQQNFELIENKNAKATLILFAGGRGTLKLSLKDSRVIYGWGKNNFLVRNRKLFMKSGFNVAIVDAPSDMQKKRGMFGEFRSSSSHAQDIDKVIKYLKDRFSLPLFLVGTSRGTLSAVNLAINSKEGVDGLVILSSISIKSKKGLALTQMPLEKIKVPVFTGAHEADACQYSPSKNAIKIKNLLTNSKRVQLKIFEGGEELSKPCRAKAHHGYWGIDKKVVKAITTFIKQELK